MPELIPIFFEKAEAVSTEVTKYVEQFNQFSRTTSNSIVNMGRVVFEAKQKLPRGHFVQFCEQIRYDSDSSAIRKLSQIGEKAELLARHSDKLPSTWTTIYTLTQLGNEVLESKLESGEIHAAIGGSDAAKLVDQHLGKKPKTKTSSLPAQPDRPREESPPDVRYECVLRFDELPSKEKFEEFERQVLDLINQHELDCRLIRNTNILNHLYKKIDHAE